MKLLVFDFGAYTMPDILYTLKELHIEYRLVSYHFDNKNEDDFFVHRFLRFIREDQYDAVFSVNYFPLVAECCRQENKKYISWSYDCPLNVPKIEETLGYDTNFVFLFDRIEVEKYQKLGFQRVYHIPLAVNTKRLDAIVLSKKDIETYKSSFSFVGKLYESPLGSYMSLMDEYCKGYIQAVCDAQLKLYGAYIVDTAINETLLTRINEQIKKLDPKTNFYMTKEALSYAMAAQVTRNERLILLNLLSNHQTLKLYTRDDTVMIQKAIYMGSCGYHEEMYKIFKATDVNLNISLKIIQSGISLRQLDIMGAGGFLLSNYQMELADYFENNAEVVMYESIEDAYEKAEFYMGHKEIRDKVAQNGYRKVKECFSYDKQLQSIFEIAGCM